MTNPAIQIQTSNRLNTVLWVAFVVLGLNAAHFVFYIYLWQAESEWKVPYLVLGISFLFALVYCRKATLPVAFLQILKVFFLALTAWFMLFLVFFTGIELYPDAFQYAFYAVGYLVVMYILFHLVGLKIDKWTILVLLIGSVLLIIVANLLFDAYEFEYHRLPFLFSMWLVMVGALRLREVYQPEAEPEEAMDTAT